jgi:hypothetical protein
MGGQCVDDDGLSEWAADHGPIGKIAVSVEKNSQISFTDGPWISRIGNADEHI